MMPAESIGVGSRVSLSRWMEVVAAPASVSARASSASQLVPAVRTTRAVVDGARLVMWVG
jgi:hypothetical protein